MPKTFKSVINESGYTSFTSFQKACNIPYSTMMDIYTGKAKFSNVRVGNAIKIAKALNTTVENLFDLIK